MANDFEVSTDVAADADAVWRVAGDYAGVATWLPAVTSVTVDGEVRTATMAYGAVLTEHLVHRDDAARTLTYSVVDGVPGLKDHRATIRVEPAEGGSRVHWRQVGSSDVEGYDIESRLRGPMTAGLQQLKEIVEGGGTSPA
jgi:mxaD protein